ncbi:ABC-2 transporter permease [Ornithinibacillus californiensis]|uniref:ABC-2 transporter permease n=1 Tax=Ornithinibacillus californiensis TaxID=161536 RepID=UPI00064DBEC7|nr:ABC-2 transporter permease [Ornithinibacillus californiensis]
MKQLYIKDVKVSALYLVLFALFIIITYVFHVNSIGISMMIMLGFVVLMFYFDSHNQVYRSLVSMPLRRKQFVLARYIFLYTTTIGFILLIWLMDYISLNIVPSLGNFTFLTAENIVQNLFVISLLMAISLPIFYSIKSFSHAMIVFMVTHVVFLYTYTIFTGNSYITVDEKISSFIHPILNIQPYLLPLLASLFVIGISYFVSVYYFTRRDIE